MFRFRASWAAAVVAIFAMCGCAEGQADNPRDSAPTLASAPCPPQADTASALPVIASVPLPNGPVVLSDSDVSLPLAAVDDRATAQRLATASRNDRQAVVLQLRCVEADRAPGAMWEVYVGLPVGAAADAGSPHFVGNVVLLNAGLRSEASAEPFAEFNFVLDRALAASPRDTPLQVTFVAHSGVVVDGRPTPPQVATSVRIGEMNLLLEDAPTPG